MTVRNQSLSRILVDDSTTRSILRSSSPYCHFSAGREAELEAIILKSVEFVRKAEPDITYRAYRSKKDPSVFVYYEMYSRLDAQGVPVPSQRLGVSASALGRSRARRSACQ